MTVQDDKAAGETEKPEPGDEAKEKAAEMMSAYDEKPTVVLPGSGGAISGTAVNAWLDEDGKPKYNNEVDGAGSDDDGPSDEDKQAQIEKDMALNEELRKAAAKDDKGEKRGP